MTKGDVLSDKEEGFCQYLVRWGCATTAYKLNYDTSRMNMSTLYRRAWELKNKPKIAARLKELRDRSVSDTIEHVRKMVQDASSVADADPNQVMQYQHNNCRHCFGIDHKWQWKNPMEFSNAVAAAAQRNAAAEEHNAATENPKMHQKLEPMPTDDGGYGFILDKRPNPECPVCLGEGLHRVWIADTRTLGPNEQKLFAGIKQTRDGIEVKIADQHAARDQLARLLGAYKDPATVAVVLNQQNNGGDANTTVVVPASPQEAADFYSNIVKGFRSDSAK